jgi:hypothetical protein
MPSKKTASDTPTKKTAKRPPRTKRTTATTRRRDAAAGSQPAKSTPTVSEERIRERAYHVYLARGMAPGDAISDWLQAERELRGS